jgi:hypothetical protein
VAARLCNRPILRAVASALPSAICATRRATASATALVCARADCGWAWRAEDPGLQRSIGEPIYCGVSIEGVEGRAGGFADKRFRTRRGVWRRRFWWVFPVVVAVPIAIELPIALLTHASHGGFWTGLALGAGAGAGWVMFDSPPHHVERWRTGADGEKATARQLRPLLKQGWTLYNDIETAYGNIDHVLVGPGGVFMLESKRLAGVVRVEAGKLVVCWHEDSEDGYENDSIAGRARGAAAGLRSALEPARADAWVQAVVVLWADFDQGSIQSEKVAWVRGDRLADVLEARPVKCSSDAVEHMNAAMRSAVTRLRKDVQDRLSA